MELTEKQLNIIDLMNKKQQLEDQEMKEMLPLFVQFITEIVSKERDSRNLAFTCMMGGYYMAIAKMKIELQPK
jgi:hypothetical protein